MIYELLKLNCEDTKTSCKECKEAREWNYEDFISLKNKINLIIRELNDLELRGVKE